MYRHRYLPDRPENIKDVGREGDGVKVRGVQTSLSAGQSREHQGCGEGRRWSQGERCTDIVTCRTDQRTQKEKPERKGQSERIPADG